MRTFIVMLIIAAAFVGSFAIRRWTNITAEGTLPPPTSQPCERLLCLSPGLTETVFALGLGDRVVGVTRYCQYPPEARERISVGGFLDPNYEAIVSLRPDIVFVTPYQQNLTQDLRRLGVVVQSVSQDSLSDIRESYRHLGALCGCQEQADALTDALDACLARVTQGTERQPRQRVLMTTGRDVRSGTLDEVYAVGRGTFLDELLTLLGGENIAPGNLLEYPSLSGEGILRIDPDIIIELVADQEYDEALEAQALAAWRTLPGLRAYRENRIFVLFGGYLTIPGPRVNLTLEALAQCLRMDADGTK